ncbi:MAG: tRNA pseudouridine(38-40) synthase TruA [Spirochaetia bacterium]|nr:tRNA pseudouridine(38-40) synthase TruA [Spirochaetia bacterium]
MKFAFTIQYDGSDFFGFQRQKDFRSVQEELEKAFEIILRQKVTLHVAGRTDTGVHALGQVVHFRIENKDSMVHDLRRFIYAVNSILPKDVSLVYGKPVSNDFHARFSCKGRDYIYRILHTPYRMAFYEKKSFWIRKKLNINLMRETSNYLLGEKDFAAFTKGAYFKNKEKTIRRIDKISIIEHGPFVDFYYSGSGFLHNMIRIVTGTLLMAGKEEIRPEAVKEILNNKERKDAGQTLPSYALFFLNAFYDEYETPKELIPFYYDLEKIDKLDAVLKK